MALPLGTSGASLPHKTVLIIDDDPLFQEELTGALVGAGYRVMNAYDGEAGLRWSRSGSRRSADVKRHGFRRAWYIIRTGAEKPDWEKLGGDYFIAPWEKKGFERKKAGKIPADTVGT
jgi:hypothetical protein